MRALLLAALLSANPPPSPAQAQKLAAQRAWEDLYLAYTSADRKGYEAPQRGTIASSLLKGCAARVGSDAVMAD